MFTIIIQEKGGEQRRMVFNKPEVTIGRVQGNDIVLPKGNVSKRHARIVLKDGKFIIVDLKSTNGTYVNGRKITSPLVVKDSDKIYIGDFIVGVDEAAQPGDDQPAETTTSPPGDRLDPPSPGGRAPPADMAPPPRPPRPTEAQSTAMPGGPPLGNMNSGPMGPMGGNLGGMDPPPMPSGGPPPRSVPPRPAPGRPPAPVDMGGAPPPMVGREPPGGPMGSPDGPMGGPIGGPMANRPPGGPLGPREPGGMPPIAPPPADRPRPGIGRPGGTMPPPMAPIPSPTAAAAPPPMAVEPLPPPVSAAPPMAPARPQPSSFEPPAPVPMPTPAVNGPSAAPDMSSRPPPVGAPAPVVPLADGKGKARLVGAGVKKVVGRSVSMPGRRGVHLDPLDPKVVKMLDLQSNILERLRTKLDIDKIPIERLHEEDLWQRAERATIDLVETLETSGELPKYIDQDTLIKETLNEALALGPLEDLLADEKIDEIIIDRRDRVVVGKEGQLRGSGKAFSSDDVFERVVKRLVAEAGAQIDDAHPLVDLRMRDGTRLTAAVSPVAARGACLVLKKPPAQMPGLQELVQQSAMTSGMADFLTTCVTARRNVLVCGGPGSGKTSIVAALAASSPAGERVVSIEEVAELSIARDEWIQLEARAGTNKHQSIDLGHLLETALRLAPDRLVVGEVRGREALPLVSALCSSVDGATVAMTGEGASNALGRLVALMRIAAPGAIDSALRELVAQAFEIVIHVARWTDGTVRVLAIEEVIGCSDAGFDTNTLFEFRDNSFHATGTVPRFYAELQARGIPADQAVFR